MTRKHFEGVAKVMQVTKPVEQINGKPDYGELAVWKETVHGLAQYFRTVNPNFDTERFVAACYR